MVFIDTKDRASGQRVGPLTAFHLFPASPILYPQCKLQLVVGSPASCMELELHGPDDKFYCKLDQDDALLGSYPVDDGCRIHVRPPYRGSLPSVHLFIQQMFAVLCKPKHCKCDNQDGL